MSTATVSVLIPTFNRAHYLAECLDSILNQTVKPHQVIVIDDGSEDATQEILQPYIPHVLVLQKTNGGKSTALNYGLKYATGEYIWVFDDDDVALPDAIEKRLAVFNVYPDTGFVYSSHYLGCDDDHKKIRQLQLHNIEIPAETELFFTKLTGFFFTLQSVLARKDCYDKVGAYDESLFRGQDYDILIRLSRACIGRGINEPTFIFRKHPGERGPKIQTHQADSKGDVWAKFDLVIGKKIRESLGLNEYLTGGLGQSSISGQIEREALIGRMHIMASKGMIPEMLVDLKHAVDVDSQNSLSAQEQLLCRKTVCLARFLAMLPNSYLDLLNCLHEISRTVVGVQIIKCFSKGMFWVVRKSDLTIPEKLRCVSFMLNCFKIIYLKS